MSNLQCGLPKSRFAIGLGFIRGTAFAVGSSGSALNRPNQNFYSRGIGMRLPLKSLDGRMDFWGICSDRLRVHPFEGVIRGSEDDAIIDRSSLVMLP